MVILDLTRRTCDSAHLHVLFHLLLLVSQLTEGIDDQTWFENKSIHHYAGVLNVHRIDCEIMLGWVVLLLFEISVAYKEFNQACKQYPE